jgi:arylsulfatase A-like enzyme
MSIAPKWEIGDSYMIKSRREFHKDLLSGVAALAAMPAVAARAASTAPPNVIFLLTDDQRWDQLGCAGHPFVKTPNMDRIAKEGARFTNMFVTTSLCSPSRASFLTGRYAHAHGVMDNKTDIADAEIRRSYPALLQKAGYETAYVGKLHLGNHSQPHPGFDYWAVLPGQGRYIDPQININGEMKTLAGHSGKATTDLALEWLRKPRQKPFCLTLGFKEPHDPRTPPDHLKDLYRDAKFEFPAVTADQVRGKPKQVQARQKNLANRNLEAFSENRRNYLRCITAADEQIGRVLRYLDEAGLAENTIVAFAGDNGYFVGEFGLGDKRYAYDPSLRIPMLVLYPKAIKPGTIVDQMALNIDLCPTVLDFAGVKIPEAVHGSSWRPLLEGKPVQWRSSFLYEYSHEEPFPPPTMKGIRTGRYKYLEYPGSENTPELYDLAQDPHEWNNLSDKETFRPLIEKLKAEMEGIEARTR